MTIPGDLPSLCGIEPTLYNYTLSVISWILLLIFIVLFIWLVVNIISHLKNKQKILNKRNIILLILLIVVLILIPMVNWIFNSLLVGACISAY